MKTLKQIREASGGKEAYQKFFNSLLKKFGVSSPAELKGDDKKKFYDELDAGWESDDPNDKNERYEDPDNLDPETTADSDEDMADKATSQVTEASKLKPGRGKAELDINWDGDRKDIKFATTKYKIKMKPHRDGAIISGDKAKLLAYLQGQDYAMDDEDIEDLYPELMESNYPKPLSIIRQVKEFSGDAETVRRKKRRFEDMVVCEHCGKMHEEGACMEMDNNLDPETKGMEEGKMLGNIDTALASLSKKPEYKKISKNLMSLSKRAADRDKGAPKQLRTQLASLASKVDKKAGAALMRMSKLAGTYESVEEAVRQGKKIKGAKLGKAYPVLDAGTQRKVKAIAKKHSGDMERALKDIEKLKKGLGDNPDVMDILRRANEDVNEGVAVDRRTKGFKDAMIRNEKSKKVREKAKAKKEKKKDEAELDARYEYDGEVDTVLAAANAVMNNTKLETAANAVAHGGVDMAPNAGKKKKKEKLMARRGY